MKIEDIIALCSAESHGEGYLDRAKQKWAYTSEPGPITPDMLRTHLDGGKPLGMHLFKQPGKSHILVYDIDDKTGSGGAIGAALEIANALSAQGVPFVVFRSGGGHGVHIMVFFDKAQPVADLLEMAQEWVNSAGPDHEQYIVGGDGALNVAKLNAKGKITHIEHRVEVYPYGSKQNVAVPCGRKSVPLRVVKSGGVTSLEECSLDDLEMAFVVMPEREVAPKDIADEDRDAAFEAFIRHYNVDGRDSWSAAGLALVAAFGKTFKPGSGSDAEWAHDRWVAWTKTSSKYRAGDEHAWKDMKPEKNSRLSFWRIAAKNGYRGPWPGSKTQVSKDALDAFGNKWALIAHESKLEFMDTTTGQVLEAAAFNLLTMPDERVRETWKRSPERRMFTGFTYAPPDYVGDKWNLYRGTPVAPESGDASLFEKYVVELLCGGDVDLAHWIMTFVADGVQRPWSERPGTGLAFRGPQGSGKSFLGFCIQAALGTDMALEVHESDRIMQKHNEIVKNKTFLLCDEAIFTGSHKQADLLKNLITARTWTFEPKHRAAYSVPHITRIIATTNKAHAVAIDNDDRRWTIHNSLPVCPHPPTSQAAREWWEPYYEIAQKRPGVILRYLLDYKVDRALISLPHHTQAKAEDKLTSDPILQAMVQMVETGMCFDDLRGDGRVSSASLAKVVNGLSGSGFKMASQTVASEVRNRFGAVSVNGCIQITGGPQVRTDRDGGDRTYYPRDLHKPGLKMPPLRELRARVSAITGLPHDGPNEWVAFKPTTMSELAVEDYDPNDPQAQIAALRAELAKARAQISDLETKEVPF